MGVLQCRLPLSDKDEYEIHWSLIDKGEGIHNQEESKTFNEDENWL